MKSLLPTIALAAVVTALAPAPQAATVAKPAAATAEVDDVTTTLHGVTVHDPYRWLEDVKSAPAQAWLRGQAAATRDVLDRIAVRDALESRIAELSAASGDAVRSVVRMPGDRFFYLKRGRAERQYKLVMRHGLSGAESVVVDPEREASRTGIPHAINYFQPSWDGRYVAYGMSAGGSENATLHIVDTVQGKAVGEPIARVSSTPMHWLPDSRSLTFTQLKALAASDPATDYYKDARVLWLQVGAPATAARPVFGPTVTRGIGLERLDVAQLIVQPGSRWMIARTTDTTLPAGRLYVAPLAELGGTPRWTPIADASAQIIDVALQGNELYLLSQKNASRRRLLKLDLRQPQLERAEAVIAEPEGGVLEAFVLTPGGIVATVREGTAIGLRRYTRGDRSGRVLPMPTAGAATLTRAPAQDSDALIYGYSSWTALPRYYRLDGERSVEWPIVTVPELPPLPALQVTDVEVPSHDGVKVPMTILHRKGLALDGHNPVLLSGYASYGRSETAFFGAGPMAWIERGGVLAYVNARGSGVYGDDWHRAGSKQNKRNTWLDGIAAAKYLIASGYGSPSTLAASGGSAGGIFVGRMTTTAPELFAAAVYNVGSLDTVRAEHSANGATNVSEFGTVEDTGDFKGLLEMSTYHAIRDGVAYPAVLLVHGMNDPRVEVWQSAKTAARLQAATSSGKPVLLRLDMQAGHGIGSTATQRYAMQADIYAFLLWQMGRTTLKD